MKWLSLCLTMLLILTVGIVGVVEAQDWEIGENRIPNSHFEDDGVGFAPTGWTLEDATAPDRGGDYEWEVDKDGHDSDNCLKIIGVKATGTGWHAKVRYDGMSMEAMETFTIAFWARVDPDQGDSREVTTSVQEQHDPWTGWHSAAINLVGADWAEYFDTFTANGDVEMDMWVGLSIAQSDVDFWIDDFRFFEGDPEDEIGADPADFAVTPAAKVASTWGGVKGKYR